MSSISSSIPSTSDLTTRLESLRTTFANNPPALSALNNLLGQSGSGGTGTETNDTSSSALAADVASISQTNQEAALSLINDPQDAANTTAQTAMQFLAPGSTALNAQSPVGSDSLLALLAAQ